MKIVFPSFNRQNLLGLAVTSILLSVFTAFGYAQNGIADTAKIFSPELSILEKESPFFINVHGGYAIGLGSTFKFYPDDISSISVTQVGNGTPTKTTTYSSPIKGLGDGFRFGVGGYYILNDFINVGLDLDYFKSTIHKDRDSSYSGTKLTSMPNGMDSYNYTEQTRTSYEATLLTLSPNITFKAISKPKWYLYNKLGAIITFRPGSTQNNVQNISTRSGWQAFYKDSTTTNGQTYDWGIRNPALGFMGGIGMQYKINRKFRAYAEAQFTHIVFTVKSRTTTSFVVNNKEMVETLPTSARIIEFTNSFTEVQTTPNPELPSRTLTQRIPITYIGLQAGISYRL